MAYRLFRRSNGVFYVQHNSSGKQKSLKTKDRQEAKKLLEAHNEVNNDADLNHDLGMIYLKKADTEAIKRKWNNVFVVVSSRGKSTTKRRRRRCYEKSGFDEIRDKLLVATTADDFLKILNRSKRFDNDMLKLPHICILRVL